MGPNRYKLDATRRACDVARQVCCRPFDPFNERKTWLLPHGSMHAKGNVWCVHFQYSTSVLFFQEFANYRLPLAMGATLAYTSTKISTDVSSISISAKGESILTTQKEFIREKPTLAILHDTTLHHITMYVWFVSCQLTLGVGKAESTTRCTQQIKARTRGGSGANIIYCDLVNKRDHTLNWYGTAPSPAGATARLDRHRRSSTHR